MANDARRFDPQAARTGLALLQIQARASDAKFQPGWRAKEAVMAERTQPDPGALSIAPADGYQYGDDHAWSHDKQGRLVDRLGKLLDTLPDEKGPATV